MIRKINIVLVEDHDAVRQGMKSYLSQQEDMNIVFDVANGKKLLEELESAIPDIILLDIAMPEMNGIEVMHRLKEKYPDVKVIVISGYYTTLYISHSVALGARAFLPKHSDLETIVQAIHSVDHTGYFFYGKASRALFEKTVKEGKTNPLWYENTLSRREIEILKLVCLEKSNEDIAKILFLSKRTVEDYKSAILSKTDSKNVVGLVLYSIKQGIIPDPATED